MITLDKKLKIAVFHEIFSKNTLGIVKLPEGEYSKHLLAHKIKK